MINRTVILTKYLFSKIPKPRDPTMGQSFQSPVSKKQAQILMDPKGFMSQEQKMRQQQNKPSQNNQQGVVVNGVKMQPQYGFKPKGPQPTRYGDWQVKGKCVDF